MPGMDNTYIPSYMDPETAAEVVRDGNKIDSQYCDCHHHCICLLQRCTYRNLWVVHRDYQTRGGDGGDGEDGEDGTPGTDGEDGGDGEYQNMIKNIIDRC